MHTGLEVTASLVAMEPELFAELLHVLQALLFFGLSSH